MNDEISFDLLENALIDVDLGPAIVHQEGGDPYEGPYEVTPTRETQVLNTADKKLDENITVHPIPSNYGLITYNGFEIMVS